MIKRKKTKQIFVGNVPIGGNADIAVQSMCNTPTWDVEKTVNQIKELEAAGCEIIRVAVPDKKSADALKAPATSEKKILSGRLLRPPEKNISR